MCTVRCVGLLDLNFARSRPKLEQRKGTLKKVQKCFFGEIESSCSLRDFANKSIPVILTKPLRVFN
jgi:hypothetical protein